MITGIRDYLLWEEGKTEVNASLLGRYDQYLQEYVYDKIWMKPTSNEQLILKAFRRGRRTGRKPYPNNGIRQKVILRLPR